MLLVIVWTVLLVIGVAACGGGESSGSSGDASGRIAGAGSTAQEVAQKAWIAEFNLARPKSKQISYESVGSPEGRDRFIAGEVAFAGSDTPLTGAELEGAVDRCRPGKLIEIPVYVSTVVIVYNLQNSGLYFTPAMLVRIFKGGFDYWDDLAIRRENPSISPIGLPHVRIVPIYRSGESGTTQNFTEYLAAAAPNAWPYPASGSWPLEVGEAVDGTAAMIEAIYAREGTVGYIDASQSSELGRVSPKVGIGYVRPSEQSARKAFGEAIEAKALAKSPYMFPFDFDRKTDSPGAYPITFVPYLIACTKYDSADEATVVKEYLEYVTSSIGQESVVEEAASVPLPAGLQKRIQPAIEAIG